MCGIKWTSLKLKIFVLLFFFISLPRSVFSQDTINQVYTRNVIWTTPVKRNTIINGVAIGFQASTRKGASFIKINGLNIEIAPFGILAGMYALGGTISSLSSSLEKDSVIQGGGALVSRNIFQENDKLIFTKIKGVSLSLGGLEGGTEVTGITINGIVSFINKMNGFEFTGIMNLHYEFNGIMIAGLRNKVTKGNGLQVGLINTCKSGHVLQLGLVNRIGKRITPFINFSF